MAKVITFGENPPKIEDQAAQGRTGTGKCAGRDAPSDSATTGR
jgi:hypothetical protein